MNDLRLCASDFCFLINFLGKCDDGMYDFLRLAVAPGGGGNDNATERNRCF